MKQAFVEGTFEHLIAHKSCASGRGIGGSTKVALARAIAMMLKQPNIRGTRIGKFKMGVVITDVNPKPNLIKEHN
jgi:hypothetical protein